MVKTNRHYLHGVPRKALMQAQGGKCFYCGNPPRRPTDDHLVPRWQGGTLVANKVIACWKCNNQKGGRMPTPEEISRARAVYALLGIPSWEIG